MSDTETIQKLRASLAEADQLLDDIDSAGDAFKPDNSTYFRYVADKCRENMDARRELLEQVHP